MLRQLSASLFFALLGFTAAGATVVYVAQAATGDASGNSPSDRMAITTINSNWTLNPGDTLSLGGIFSTNLVIGGGGVAGSPVTVLFEPDAQFSAPTWPNTGNMGGIISGGANYITIDGGANGLIQATDNGYAKDFSNSFCALNLSTGTGLEIKNLNIVNLNPRQSNIVDNACAPTAIRVGGAMTNLLIHNCNITNVGNGIVVYPQTGVSTNVQVYSNNVFYCSWGIYCEPAANGSLEYGTRIWRNRINNGTGWDAISPGPFHNDGIIVGVPNISTNSGMMIYWNIIGPDSGYHTTTSALYWETTMNAQFNQNGLVFDNVFLENPGQIWNSGFISINGSGMGVYNNTIAQKGFYQGQTGIGVGGGNGSTGPSILNNVMQDISTAVYLASVAAPLNVTPTNGLTSFGYNYVCFGVGQDRAHGFGAPHSTSTGYSINDGYAADWVGAFKFYAPSNYVTYADPTYIGQFPAQALLDTNGYFAPLTNDVALGAGTNLTALANILGVPELKFDISGNQRPPTGAWTIGAFQTASPPTVLNTLAPPTLIANSFNLVAP